MTYNRILQGLICVVLLALVSVLLSGPLSGGAVATAGTFERMVMPGAVIKGHAKYENECAKCHRPFSKALQKKLCLDCHKLVSGDIKGVRGYHGRSAEVKGAKCRHCHTEHKGRQADVVGMDKDLFDHSVTDFALKGAHASVKCSLCHKRNEKYRQAPAKCVKCHREDDAHKERLGAKCADCHVARSWKKPRFDHDKTGYVLKGGHKKTFCNRCHPNDRYKKTPKLCYSCHRLSDVHGGEYGRKCADCHTPRGWKRTRFNHEKTDFRLKGAHVTVTCAKCHKGALKKGSKTRKKLPVKCAGCHKNDDEHRGRYGNRCADCHTPKEWKRTRFNHDKTEFRLKGAHVKVTCVKCHKGALYARGQKKKGLEKSCAGCHRHDDVHNSRAGQRCEKCHNNKSWTDGVLFDHDLSRFPLIGLHAVAPCEACHSSSNFKKTARVCESCHRNDDVHKKGLGPECGACHNPNGWRLWKFDHDGQTDFELDGAHKGLDCRACHWRPARRKVSASGGCITCHREDDAHRGGFGFQCQRCHTTVSFDEIKMAD